ncbi:unnamed protein product [Cuscuta europaea]|uniref:Uncharacterized protein n=1 Tax=Cuscuta europaea TaxID=41803 RepID=A0A9P0Z087_CUSEU|nr:unnamed protein product [Cuscuta europaea]
MYALSEALALAQNPLSEEDLVINILNGLGTEYSDLTSAIRVRTTPLPLAELQDILLEREERLQASMDPAMTNVIPTANATQAVDRHFQNNDRRTSPGGDRSSFTSRRGRGTYHGNSSRQQGNPLVCRFCENLGHEVRQCRKLQRFLKEHYVPHPAPPAVNHTVTNPQSMEQPWLFDSGASHHVTTNAANLPSYTDYGGPEEVHLGNGSSHRGSNNARGEH